MAAAALFFACSLSTGKALPIGGKLCASIRSSLHRDFSSHTITFRQVDSNGAHPCFKAVLNNTATET
jgi:hypothetical protein